MSIPSILDRLWELTEGYDGHRRRPDPPPQPPELHYSVQPSFCWGAGEPTPPPEPSGCVRMDVSTGREIMRYARFLRALYRPEEETGIVTFRATFCPLSEHFCFGNRGRCLIGCAGDWQGFAWTKRAGERELPVN